MKIISSQGVGTIRRRMNEWEQPFIIRDRRSGDWYWVQKDVLSSNLVKSSSKLVYDALAFYANNKSQTAYPSITTIADLIKINRDTVIFGLKELEANKFIHIKREKGKPNLYTLLRVVGNSDQYEKKDGGSPSFPTGVVGKEGHEQELEQDLYNNTEEKLKPRKTPVNPKLLKNLKEELKVKDIIR